MQMVQLKVLWFFIKAPLITWLDTRALVVPQVKIDEWSKKAGISPAVGAAFLASVKAYILDALGTMKP